MFLYGLADVASRRADNTTAGVAAKVLLPVLNTRKRVGRRDLCAVQEEGQRFERDAEVDGFDFHPRGPWQPHRRKIQDCAYSRVYDFAEHVHRGLTRHRDDGHRGPAAAYDGVKFCNVQDGDAHPADACFFGAVVEKRHDVEPIFFKRSILHERHPKVPGADDDDLVPRLQAQDAGKVVSQFSYGIAATTQAELAEIREIPPDLGRVDATLLGQCSR